MKRLTKIEYYVGFALPLILIAVGLFITPPRMNWLVFTPAGMFFWTLMEYWIHRVVLHSPKLFRRDHWVHHIRPAGYEGGITLLHAGTVFSVLWLLLINSFGASGVGFWIGTVVGYEIYSVLHHGIHHWRPVPHWLTGRFLHHNVHHCGIEANFGVTTSLWDRVFATHAANSNPYSLVRSRRAVRLERAWWR